MNDEEVLRKCAPISFIHVREARRALEALMAAETADEIALAIQVALGVFNPNDDGLGVEGRAAYLGTSIVGHFYGQEAHLDALRAVGCALMAALRGHIARYAQAAKRDLTGGVVRTNLRNIQRQEEVREIARRIWLEEGRQLNITRAIEIIKSEVAGVPTAKTLREWIADICPEHLKQRGRPKNTFTEMPK